MSKLAINFRLTEFVPRLRRPARTPLRIRGPARRRQRRSRPAERASGPARDWPRSMQRGALLLCDRAATATPPPLAASPEPGGRPTTTTKIRDPFAATAHKLGSAVRQRNKFICAFLPMAGSAEPPSQTRNTTDQRMAGRQCSVQSTFSVLASGETKRIAWLAKDCAVPTSAALCPLPARMHREQHRGEQRERRAVEGSAAAQRPDAAEAVR